MRKIVTASAGLLLSLTLVGCGNKTIDNTGKTPAKTSSAKVVSKSSSSKKKDDQEVTSGPMIKSGQWKNDDDMGKIVLGKIVAPNTPTSQSGVTYTLKDIKQFTVTPKTQYQKETYKNQFGADLTTDTYTYVQVDFNVKNDTTLPLDAMNVKNIVLADGSQLDPNNGDSSTMSEVASKANKDDFTDFLIPNEKISQTSKLTISFDYAYNESSGETIADNFAPLTVDFK